MRKSAPRFAACLRALGALMLCLALLAPGALAEGEEMTEADAPLYIENEWNYVDGSMDVSQGIPSDAVDRLARIREAGKLTVATEPYFPPQEFIDDAKAGQERYVGADMELARRIAQRMGVALEIVPLDFTEVLSSVADGQYDLAISALAFTSGRAAMLEMSKGYYFADETASSGLLIRTESAGDIAAIEDLATRDIVAQSGSLQETLAAENIPFYRRFRRLPTIEDVYHAVEQGEADAAVVDIDNAHVHFDSHPDCGLQLVEGVAFTLEPQYEGDRVAARKGERQLIYFVNGVIDEVVESGEYARWFDEYARYDAGA